MLDRSRRNFIKLGSLLTAAMMMPRILKASPVPALPKLNLFSKHLQFLDYHDMANAAKEIGFDGIDLTVRPNGHVEPEKVEFDLPVAAEAIRSTGLDLEMMTTTIDDAEDPIDRNVLRTAKQEGLSQYRMNWYRYPVSKPLQESLEAFKKRTEALSRLNSELGLIGSYQNHSGLFVGASLWEIWKLLQGSDKSHMGVQYDIRHATVEGGRSWKNGLRLIRPHIKSIVVKDVRWEGTGSDTKLVNTPLGQGMVDFKAFFRILKEAEINVPVTFHFEYDLGGAEWGGRDLSINPEKVYEAMHRDIETFKTLWNEA